MKIKYETYNSKTEEVITGVYECDKSEIHHISSLTSKDVCKCADCVDEENDLAGDIFVHGDRDLEYPERWNCHSCGKTMDNKYSQIDLRYL